MRTLVFFILSVFSTHLWATNFASCKKRKAYKDSQFNIATPRKDWICRLKPALTNPRCIEAQKMICEGGSAVGPKDVPSGAWFLSFVESVEGPIRCTCGCFKRDTESLTVFGIVTAAILLEPFCSGCAPDLKDVTAHISFPLRADYSLLDKETEPVYRFYFDNGRELTLTSKYPILVERNGEIGKIRARKVVVGDMFFDDHGCSSELEEIQTNFLPKNEYGRDFSLGYQHNLENTITANSRQVGDNMWQVYLEFIMEDLKKMSIMNLEGKIRGE